MSAALAVILVIGIAVVLYLMLGASVPESDLIFSSASEEEIEDLRRYLHERGVPTYVKNMGVSRLIPSAHDLVNPSLHVVRIEDKKVCMDLTRTWLADRGKGRCVSDGGHENET